MKCLLIGLIGILFPLRVLAWTVMGVETSSTLFLLGIFFLGGVGVATVDGVPGSPGEDFEGVFVGVVTGLPPPPRPDLALVRFFLAGCIEASISLISVLLECRSSAQFPSLAASA
jgi:hypothetical protein